MEKSSYDESAVKHSAAKCKDFSSINYKCTQFEISVLAQSLLTCFFMQAVLDCCNWRWQNPLSNSFTRSLFFKLIEQLGRHNIAEQFTSLSDIVRIFNWTVYIYCQNLICHFSCWLPLSSNIYFQLSILIILHYKSRVAFILFCIGYHAHFHILLLYLVKLLYS